MTCMYGRTTKDVAATLQHMQEEARTVCRNNQGQMAKQMATWMAQDRRFDGVPDKERLARDAMDARSHGRVLDLTPRMTSGANSTPGYISRNV